MVLQMVLMPTPTGYNYFFAHCDPSRMSAFPAPAGASGPSRAVRIHRIRYSFGIGDAIHSVIRSFGRSTGVGEWVSGVKTPSTGTSERSECLRILPSSPKSRLTFAACSLRNERSITLPRIGIYGQTTHNPPHPEVEDHNPALQEHLSDRPENPSHPQ